MRQHLQGECRQQCFYEKNHISLERIHLRPQRAFGGVQPTCLRCGDDSSRCSPFRHHRLLQDSSHHSRRIRPTYCRPQGPSQESKLFVLFSADFYEPTFGSRLWQTSRKAVSFPGIFHSAPHFASIQLSKCSKYSRKHTRS